jgi:hypothetical protein
MPTNPEHSESGKGGNIGSVYTLILDEPRITIIEEQQHQLKNDLIPIVPASKSCSTFQEKLTPLPYRHFFPPKILESWIPGVRISGWKKYFYTEKLC